VEASTLQAPATLAQPRVRVATPLLRFRSDEQLVALFRAGHDEAFRAIHDRYHKRLFAYARQMLPGRQDAEDALQDVFVRAYSGLRASDRDLALRAWLFRVAHNRCIDELRRPAPPPPEVLQLVRTSVQDPIAEVDTRESLRRLIADVRRLPEQQRSALLMRELAGMSYAELATSLGISIGAVKSVLVRARIALVQAAEARDTACFEIREELAGAHDRGVRPNANARRHMRDCTGCRSYRRELRGVTRQLAGLAPAIGPLGVLAKLVGFSGGASSGATAGGATAGGAAVAGGGGLVASGGGAALGAGHVATLIAAAVATAGGAVEIQHTISAPQRPAARVHVAAKHHGRYTPVGVQPTPPAASAVTASFPPTAAAAEAARSVAQKAPVPLLERRAAIKRKLRQSPPSETGGGAMVGTATSTPASTESTGTCPSVTTDSSVTGGTTTGTATSGDCSLGTGASTTSTGTGATSSGTSGDPTAGGSGSGTGSTTNTTNGSSSSSTASGGSTSATGTGSGSGSGSTGSGSSGSGSSTGSSGSGAMVPPK
jgi:RNA polymerase sigma factor (sigma-70 family)